MAELTESEIITKLNTIDAEIDKIVSVLGTSGSSAVEFLDYKVGELSVGGSERLKALRESRKVYQDLLKEVPKLFIRDHGYDIEHGTGKDNTEYIGDE